MEGMIGEIKLFAGTFVPESWFLCDGQVLPIAQYQALFSILGTEYGGDGRTNFKLPKLAPLASAEGASIRYILCAEGAYPRRS